MIFIEVAGYSTVAMYLAIYYIYLRDFVKNKKDSVVWVVYDTFLALMTTLMAVLFSLAMNNIKSQIKQFNIEGLRSNKY